MTTSDPGCTWSASVERGVDHDHAAAPRAPAAARSRIPWPRIPGAPRTGTLTIAGQTFTVTQASGSPTALPLGWSNGDVGSTGVTGKSTYDTPSTTFSIKGGGADVWGIAATRSSMRISR